MTSLKEIIEIMREPDRVKIVQEGKTIYTGFIAGINGQTKGDTLHSIGLTGQEEIERIRMEQEIRHRDWKRKGLMAPLNPSEAPDYSFTDLQMKLWFVIILKKRKG